MQKEIFLSSRFISFPAFNSESAMPCNHDCCRGYGHRGGSATVHCYIRILVYPVPAKLRSTTAGHKSMAMRLPVIINLELYKVG